MTITVPAGFRLAGVHAGIKRNPNKEDVTLVVADKPAVAAGVYTQNLVCAAPVLVDRQRTPSDQIRVVVVNSGNANACTGERGMQSALEMARLAAEAVGAKAEQALVMSTGIIGVHLPIEKVAAGISGAFEKLAADDAAFMSAARGIMTTDKGPKTASRTLQLGGRTITIAGMAKGAGMIGPNMATMLGLMLTDAVLTPADAQRVLKAVADESFNCISVEGHTSTNDSLVLLASGAAGGAPLAGDDLAVFQKSLTEVCIDVAKQIPSDGEGATHLIMLDIAGCATRDAARQIAATVADSALVKTAIAGGDPNWGRIVSAAGYAGVPFDPTQVDLSINGLSVYERGAPASFEAAVVSRSIKASFETHIKLRVGRGPGAIRFWTSDLTVEYVRFNADYST